MLRLSIAFILFLLPGLSMSQFTAPESKEEALKRLQLDLSDSSRQLIYNFLGEIYFSGSRQDLKMPDSAFYYLRKAVYLHDSINTANKEITNESLRLLAQTYLAADDTATAKKIFLQVIKNYQQHNQKKKEADTWRLMGRELWNHQPDISYVQFCFDKAIQLYEQEKDTRAKAELMIDKINFFTGIGKLGEADKELWLLVKEAKANNAKYLPDIYIMLAKENRYEGNLNKALAYALEATEYGDKSRDKKDMHNIYGELAQIYEDLGEAGNSVYWYKQCIAQREKLKLPQFIMYRTMSLMVNQMIKIGQANEAIVLLRQLAKKSPATGHIEKASLAQSFAYCYKAMNQPAEAEAKFLEMIKQFNSGETHKEFLTIAYYDIGEFYVSLQQFSKAESYLKSALAFANGTSVLSRQKDLNLLLFKVDSANGNLASAITYFQNYKIFNDSIFNIVKSQQISDLMIRYESEKKDNNINYLEKEGKLREGKITQANKTRNWMLGAALLLFIITASLIYTARLRQRTNKKLQFQQLEIKAKNNSLQQLVKEKEWLVKEIHHRVKNNFHMVMGLLGTQSSYLKSQEAIEAMNESQQRVHAMSLVHQKLYQSDNLSAINMPGYLHELIDYLRDSFNLRKTIQFQLEVDPIELELSHCLPLGLIVNEAVTNSIKYAFPQNREGIIYIGLKITGEKQLQLMVHDNGIGLPENFTPGTTGAMGFNLMEGLSEDIDGKLSIKSNGGTEILLAFTYNRNSI